MTIHSRSNMPKKVQIDLSGPDGNALALVAIAHNIGRQLGKDKDELDAIRKDMLSSNYDHVVATLEKHYGDFIDIYTD